MRTIEITSKSIGVLAIVALTLADHATSGADPAANAKREPIGAVFGETVYRDEIRKDFPLDDELHRLFTRPVMQKYREEHKAEVTPTEEEIDAVTKYFEDKHREKMKTEGPPLIEELKQIEAKLADVNLSQAERNALSLQKKVVEIKLKPPGRFFAQFMLDNWKLQRHLYDKFGGGRALWQQAGVEAFDAMRTWLETHEKKGDFSITDAALRTEFYKYWKTQDDSAFLMEDADDIRIGLLEPDWAPKLKPPDTGEQN